MSRTLAPQREPLVRLSQGDLVTVRSVPCGDGDPELQGRTRLWLMGDDVWDMVTDGTPALVLKILGPVTEFRAPSPDSHWIMILIGDKLYEALSDEVVRVGDE